MQAVFLDTETNGLNPKKHNIIDIAFIIVDLFNGNIITEYQQIVSISQKQWILSDKESLIINGYTWETVAKGKKTSIVKQEIINIFQKYKIKRKKAVFICQNPSFDRIFFSKIIDTDIQEQLLWPYHWLDLASMYWAIMINENKCKNISLSKDSIAKDLHLPQEVKPHQAKNGVKHLLKCYEKLLGFPN
jgi:DNA polymerase-3 subunit epsilon/oligoribonuclease